MITRSDDNGPRCEVDDDANMMTGAGDAESNVFNVCMLEGVGWGWG